MRIDFTYKAPDYKEIFDAYNININEALFFDIETTGFSADTSSLYMVGASYYDTDKSEYVGIQWFAESKDKVKSILSDFLSFANEYSTLIHYNGDTFDIPYLRATAKKCELEFNLDRLRSIDVYKEVKRFKSILGLDNVKLKTVEQFMGLNRNDKYSGGDLINVYKEYLKDNDDAKKDLLLLHNHDDIIGLTKIIPILSYPVFFNSSPKVVDIKNTGSHIEFTLETNLLKDITFEKDDIIYSLNQKSGTIRVPRYEGVLKFFFDNYKDYYYLPLEDKAIHKSVAAFVDKEYRENAKKSNCYTKEEGVFLPNPGGYISPCFKIDYSDKRCFFKENTDILENYEYAGEYVGKLLQEK